MPISKSNHGTWLRQWWSIPIIGLCLIMVVGTTASTYTIDKLNTNADRHVDAVFIVQDLIRNVERLQRAETRLATATTVPETSFDQFTAPVYENLDALRPLVSPDDFDRIQGSVRAYETAVDAELLLVASSDREASRMVRDTRILPAATTLSSGLAELETQQRAHAEDSAQTARTLLIAVRTFGVIVLCVLLMTHDRQRRRSMATIQQKELQFRTLIQQSADIVLVTDIHGTITYVTPAAETAFGQTAEELIGTALHSHIAGDDRIRASDLIVQSIMAEGRPVRHELRFVLGDGSVRTMESVAVDLIDNESINGVVITSHDVTERKLLHESLHHQAHHDSLTGLPNRLLLADRLDQAVKRADRSADPIAVLFIDLNGFKAVNDEFGHSVGDELLRVAAGKLRGAVRNGDTIARIGGDEFVVVLEQSDREQAEATAERIRVHLQGAILQGEHHPVTASIGIAVRTDPLVEADQLLRQADAAMYEMKDRASANDYLRVPYLSAAD